MTNAALIEDTIDRLTAAIRSMAQRTPAVRFYHEPLWEAVAAAKQELRKSPTALPETVSSTPDVRVAFKHEEYAYGHYEALPRQVVDQLRSAGVPVIGEWGIRGVEYGKLTATFSKADGVVFEWSSMGEKPEIPETDLVEELI